MAAARGSLARPRLRGHSVRMADSGEAITAKGKAARDAILTAATELFAEKGVSGASITRIAAQAGVNRAMIAYYFGSKSGLYDAIIDTAVEDAAATLGALEVESDGGDPIRRLVLAFSEMLSRRPHFVRMIIHEYFQPGRLFEPETANKLSGFMRLTERVLDTVPLGPRARAYDPQILHLIMVGALNYFTLTAPFRDRLSGSLDRELTTPSVEEFAATLADIFSAGLRAQDE